MAVSDGKLGNCWIHCYNAVWLKKKKKNLLNAVA